MAVVHCTSLPRLCKPCRTATPLSPISHARLVSIVCKGSNELKLSTPRRSRAVSAVVSEENAVVSCSSGTNMFKLTYLRGNGWSWEVDGLKLLVDPILVGNLDFGIPWLYDAAKKVLKNFSPQILRVVATFNAKSLLDPLFTNVTYIEPGQSSVIEAKNGSKVRVCATPGPVLGPPWQCPENGYLVTSPQGPLTLYYEPHCVYNKNFLEKERADIIITPVIKQLLPNLMLVSGQEDAVQLARMLHAKFIVPMKNGDLDSKGFLASIIQAEGTMESFKELPDVQVLEPTPGVPLEIQAPSSLP
ncbi:hypothetical protein I3842_Q072200 [Carya illinoinensis]|uniref:Uncharacterized protein n=1 Tax=Carya illinoinensis TaxID=32201 RepID=A0A922A2X9_CARIL|nr:hypothetical protein I3842_Q072200 [Carya illinoinensis]